MIVYELLWFTSDGVVYNLDVPAAGEDVWDSVWLYDKDNGTKYYPVIKQMDILDVHIKAKVV